MTAPPIGPPTHAPSQILTARKTTNTPDLPSTQPSRARSSLSTPSNISPACNQPSSESATAAALHAPASAADRTFHNKVGSADAAPSSYPATRNNRRRTSQ